MSKVPIDWISFFLLIVLIVAAILAEIRWLSRHGWATSGLATGYVFTTSLLGLGIGLSVVMVLFLAMFMMVMGPAGRGSDVPEATYWLTTAIAIVLPPVILVLIKRIFLSIFKIRSGRPAWIYSAISSILMILIVFVPPTAIFFLFVYIAEWK